MNRIERRMASAGYHGPWPATLFAVAQFVIAAAGVRRWSSAASAPARALIFAVIAAMIAYYVPNLWLGRAINARRREIQNGLPDAIDLLIVCIESGSGIDQALNRVAEELALAVSGVGARTRDDFSRRPAPASRDWKRSGISPTAPRSMTCGRWWRC